jgi:cytochrome c biogenesis protein CcdA
LFYTLGRATSYTLLATLIYFGFSSFRISGIFQGWGDKVLGPVLILIGLVMFGVIKINFGGSGQAMEKLKEWLSRKGHIGSFLLGMLFALAFCPYSGVLFFGVLIPMVVQSADGLLLAPVFALGTGLPVIIFSFLIAFSMQKLSRAFHIVGKAEKVMRYAVATVFVVAGAYYTHYLIQYLIP